MPLEFCSIFGLDSYLAKYYVEGLMKFAIGTKAFCAVIVAATLALPAVTFGATAPAVQTRQLLPVGGNSCAQLTVSSIQEYVQEGDLHSFEVTISNPSYVALFGTIGGAPLGFQYMTRDIMPNGQLRIHVDVPIEMSHSSAISMTLLSAEGNMTCMSTIAFGVTGVDGSSPVAAETDGSSTGTGTTGTNGSNNGSSNPSQGSSPIKGGSNATPVQGTATSTASTTPAQGSLGNTLNKACDATGAYQLWFVLLALYVVIVALVALYEAALTRRSGYLPGALIVLPLLALLAFWIIAEGCRATGWMPVILLIIAAVGIATVYRTRYEVTKVIELPPAEK